MKSIGRTWLCLLLTAVMLAAGLVSCGKNGKQVPEDTETVTVDDRNGSNVPASVTFPGQEVNILIHTGMREEFVSEEEEVSTLIGNAVYRRNALTEEKRAIALNYIPREGATSGPYQNMIRTSIMSGTHPYDIVSGNAYYTAALASEGLFLNLNNRLDGKNYIVSSADWYNKSFVSDTSYRDRLYYLVGDMTISAIDRTPLIFFNEDLMSEWNITDDVYSATLDGEWTIEYLRSLVKDVYRDVDGMGEKDKGDLYGLVFNGGSMAIDGMIASVGIRVTAFGEDGEINLAWDDPTGAAGFAEIYRLMYSSDGVFTGFNSQGNYYGTATSYFSEQAFYEKRAVFATGMLMAAKSFATVTNLHYGILPLPKYEQEQDYRTTPQDGYTVIAVPYNVDDRVEIATATLETLFEESYRVIRPVYYDTVYKVRYASSENTARLFDTIIGSISFDFGAFYSHSINDPVHLLRNRLTGEGGMQASPNMLFVTAMNSDSVSEYLTDLVGKFDQLT